MIVAWEMLAGSLWDLLLIEWTRVTLSHLGYPLYLSFILGIPKLLCGVVLLIPRFPRLKEWAYAGAFFNYVGAAASHALMGDSPAWIGGALGYAIIALVSWALRPPDRQLASSGSQAEPRPTAWIIAFAGAGVLLVIAFLTLPQGPPPFLF